MRFNGRHRMPFTVAEVLIRFWIEYSGDWSVAIINSEIDSAINQLQNKHRFLSMYRQQQSVECARLYVKRYSTVTSDLKLLFQLEIRLKTKNKKHVDKMKELPKF